MPSSLLCEFLCWCQICFFLPLFEHPLEGEVCKLWSSERRKIWSRKFKSFWRLLPSIGAEFSTFSSRLTSLHHPPAIRPSFHVPVYSHTHAHLLSCLGNMEWRWDFYVCLFLDFMDRVFITGTEEHKNTELEPFSPLLLSPENKTENFRTQNGAIKFPDFSFSPTLACNLQLSIRFLFFIFPTAAREALPKDGKSNGSHDGQKSMFYVPWARRWRVASEIEWSRKRYCQSVKAGEAKAFKIKFSVRTSPKGIIKVFALVVLRHQHFVLEACEAAARLVLLLVTS